VRQSGYTSIELAVVVAAGMLALSAVAASIPPRMRTANLAASVGAARHIATEAEIHRKRVASVVAPAVGAYTYTYRDLTGWNPVTTLNGQAGLNLPTQTIYGTNYEVTAGAQSARVRFTVPFVPAQAPHGTTMTTVGGTATIVVPAPRSETASRSSRSGFIKRFYYGENVR
jgi:hypothetical protein